MMQLLSLVVQFAVGVTISVFVVIVDAAPDADAGFALASVRTVLLVPGIDADASVGVFGVHVGGFVL